jgi:hypothetical protein
VSDAKLGPNALSSASALTPADDGEGPPDVPSFGRGDGGIFLAAAGALDPVPILRFGGC